MAGPQSPQLPATLTVDRFVRLCQLGGKVPTRRLLLSSMVLRLAIPNQAAGKVPLRALLARSRVRSRVRAPQAEGSPPLSTLLLRPRWESRAQAPRAGGRAPFRPLPCRSSTVRLSRQPSSGGSVPSCRQQRVGKEDVGLFHIQCLPTVGFIPSAYHVKSSQLASAPCAPQPRSSLPYQQIHAEIKVGELLQASKIGGDRAAEALPAGREHCQSAGVAQLRRQRALHPTLQPNFRYSAARALYALPCGGARGGAGVGLGAGVGVQSVPAG